MSRSTTKGVGVALYPTQAACLQSTATYRGFCGGRGSGKSFLGAWDMLRRAKANRFYLAANPTYPNLRDTTMRMFRQIATRVGRLVAWRKGSDPGATIRTTDGGIAEVAFRSARDPESLRGPNLSGVWFDEASLMSREAFEVAIACLREGGEMGWLLATYTPKGTRSWTYLTFQDGISNTARFHSKTGDNPFLPDTFEATLRDQYSAAKQAQELEGLELDHKGACISYEHIIQCQEDGILWWHGAPPEQWTGHFYGGIDVGRSRDRSVLWVVERIGDVLWTREVLVMHQRPFAEQYEQFALRLRRRGWVRCFVDRGFNPQLAEDLVREFPGVVEGVTMGTDAQARLATQMENAFERRDIRIPIDNEIMADFQLVQKPQLSGNRVTVKTERDTTGHADRFWACALALDASRSIHAPTVCRRPVAAKR